MNTTAGSRALINSKPKQQVLVERYGWPNPTEYLNMTVLQNVTNTTTNITVLQNVTFNNVEIEFRDRLAGADLYGAINQISTRDYSENSIEFVTQNFVEYDATYLPVEGYDPARDFGPPVAHVVNITNQTTGT